MARESYDNCFDSGNSRLLNISEKNDENCLSVSLKHQPQHLVEKSVSPAGNTVCNGHGENGHDFVDVGAYLRSGEIDLDFDRVTCFATQEKGSSDDSSLLAIRKSRTNIITAIEEPIIEDSHTKENRMQKSIPIPESGMIDLSSANTIFMQSRSSNAEPLYTHKQLPPFLQETLDQSLSRLTIMIGNDKFLEEKSVVFIDYTCEEQLADLTALITKDLSEPYSIYTYRYFLHNWPHLSFLAYCDDLCVGAIVCKLDQHRKDIWRGYIAMLAVHKDFRRFKIGTKLVQKSIRRMIEQGCDEIVLETEVTNKAALNLYENLGFIRDKRLLRYYLNGVDAWRLKLWLV